jgi:hypothetical protein
MSLIVNGRSVNPDLAETNFRTGYDGGVCVTSAGIGAPTQHFLTSTGDGLTGTVNFNGNYATTAIDAYWQASAATTFDVYSVLISISDNATFNQTDYGGIVAGTIVKGIKQYVSPAPGIEVPLISGYAVTANYLWSNITPDVTLTSFAGSTGQTLIILVDLVKLYGCPLHMGKGWKFITRLNDNYTGLVSHVFSIRGKQY